MNENVLPAVVGLVTGVVVATLPDAFGTVMLVVGALVAGWVLPQAPARAAGLFVSPTIVLGAVRIILEDETSLLPALVVGAGVALIVAAVFTHIGAGIALRRST